MPSSRSLKISAFLALLFNSFSLPAHSQTATTATPSLNRCWTYQLVESAAVTLAANSEHVFIGMSGGKLDALSRGGRRMWAADLGGAISSNLIVTGNSLLLTTSPSGTDGQEKSDSVLRSLSKETGVTQWTANLPAGDRHYLHVFNGWIIAISKSGSIRSIDLNGGKLLWKREITSGFSGALVFSDATLIIAGGSNQIFKISVTNGEIEGMLKYAYPVSSLALTSEAVVIAGDERGNISSLRNGVDKPIWRFKSGGQISSLREIGGNLLAASHDNFVYLLQSGSGDLVWKRRFSGRLAYAVRMSDGNALLSSVDDNGAVLVDLNDGKIIGHLALADDEKLAAEPVSSDGSIFIVTNNAAYGYSTLGCGKNSEGGETPK